MDVMGPDALPVIVAEATVEVIAKEEKEVVMNGGGVGDVVGDSVGDAVKQHVVLQYFTASAVSHEPNPRIASHTLTPWMSGMFMCPE